MVRRSLVLVALVLMASGLAGCSGGSGDGPGDHDSLTATDDGATGPGESLTMPEWAVGDAWVYEFNGASTAYVITAETGSDWIIETDSAERSFSDAREDISRLGPQRKSDLAGSQGEDRVEFFRWPLEEGKTWSTRWDHLDVRIRVMEVIDGVATIEANLASDGSLAYRYTYVAEDRWFGDLRHFAPDGTELVHLTLTEAVRSWTGTLVRWDLVVVNETEGSDGAFLAGPVQVPEGTTDIWAEYEFTCTGAAGYVVALEPANPGLAGQQGFRESGPCVHVDESKVLVAGPHLGTWALTLDVGGETADFAYAILLRTRIDVTFPA